MNESTSSASLPSKVDFDVNVFSVIAQIFQHGDIFTKASFGIMGLSNLVRGQIIKGLLFLGSEIAFLVYLFSGIRFSSDTTAHEYCGVKDFKGLFTLGTKDNVYKEALENGITVQQKVVAGDDSSLFLLFGVVSLIIICGFVILWKANVKSAYLAQYAVERGRKPTTIFKDLSDLFDSKLHNTLLLLPLVGITAFTVTRLST